VKRILQGFTIAELHIDRAYVHSPVVDEVTRAGGKVLAKPWAIRAQRPGMFSKRDFKLDLRAKTVTCPAGEVESFEPATTIEFDPERLQECLDIQVSLQSNNSLTQVSNFRVIVGIATHKHIKRTDGGSPRGE